MRLARSARGKHAALEPLVERIRGWREQGLTVVAVARSETQAERIEALVRHRGLELDVQGRAARARLPRSARRRSCS